VRLALAPQSRVRQRVEDGAEVRTHLAEGAALSPDGRRIAFTALGALYIADAQGVAPPRKLFDGNAFQPAWSPDGRSLAFLRWTAEQGGGIWTIDAAGGAAPPARKAPTGPNRSGIATAKPDRAACRAIRSPARAG
jgi:Tol biopolymer transport system component